MGIFSSLSGIFRPLVYLSLPVIFVRTVVMSTQKGRYYVRLGVYAASMAAVATAAAFIGVALAIVGHRYDVNFVVARTFYHLESRLIGITIEVEGEEHLKTGPAVLMSNHQSMLDILFVARTMPRQSSIMSKKSLQMSPLGPFMMLAGTIFVDRGNNARAVRSLTAAGEMMKRNRTSLWIYPEGTRHLSQEPDLLPFKKGGFHLAVQAGIPIVPVVSENYWHLYRPGYFGTGVAKIRVLPPVPTDGLTTADVPELINEVRNQMLEALREISTHAPVEKRAAVPASIPTSSREEKTPQPQPAETHATRTPSTASLSSSNGTRSENSTETEEDEGMVLVGKPT